MTGFLIVDDHPMVRAALEVALHRSHPDAKVFAAGSIGEAEQQLSAESGIDIVLLDLNIPDADGLSGLSSLRAQFPRVPVLVVSGYDDPRYVARARAAGAAGFVSKAEEPERMVAAAGAVLAGDAYWPAGMDTPDDADSEEIGALLESLTPQQLRVLELLGQGLLNKQIAHELDIVESTVKAHVSAILRKLNVHSRTQAVLLAQQMPFNRLSAAQTE